MTTKINIDYEINPLNELLSNGFNPDIGDCVVQFAPMKSYHIENGWRTFGVTEKQANTKILTKDYMPYIKTCLDFISKGILPDSKEMKVIKKIMSNPKYLVKSRALLKNGTGHHPRVGKKNQFIKWVKRTFKYD